MTAIRTFPKLHTDLADEYPDVFQSTGFAWLAELIEQRSLQMWKQLLLIIISVGLAVCGQVSLKIGMNKVGEIYSAHLVQPFQTLIRVFSNPNVVLGLGLYVCASLIWLVVLSRVDLSFAYPMMGLSYVFVLLISNFFLKENVVPLRWFGAFVICTGVVLISRS
jgi:multidrug transporter EmrE-like cation transporter